MRIATMALAMSVLAIPLASAQIQLRDTASDTVQSKTAPQSQASAVTAPSKKPQAETTGGDKRNPEPHIYKLGEHLSEAYGSYEIVDNWQASKLAMPPEGHHWVRYGENYMLVTATDGLIKRIVHAS
jgi:Ni/Co efflux regulator RcnB